MAKGVNLRFWSNNSHIFNFSFSGKISQENVFYDILELKNDFVGYKDKKLKKYKLTFFQRGY